MSRQTSSHLCPGLHVARGCGHQESRLALHNRVGGAERADEGVHDVVVLHVHPQGLLHRHVRQYCSGAGDGSVSFTRQDAYQWIDCIGFSSSTGYTEEKCASSEFKKRSLEGTMELIKQMST